MRMRKKKHGESRLSACSEFLFDFDGTPMTDPASRMGMPGAKVFLEIGAGKGGFAVKMAQKHRDAAYFAMEKVTDCVVLAAEKAKSVREGEIKNLKFVIDTADNLSKIFENGTVDEIFLNFSDPWSKLGYAKRRLTHKRYLSLYLNLLKDGGRLTFKTDNDGLFDFSLIETDEMGIVPDRVTRDLHNSEYMAENVMTEYEKSFSDMGKNINMFSFVKPVGFQIEIDESLRRDRKVYYPENIKNKT